MHNDDITRRRVVEIFRKIDFYEILGMSYLTMARLVYIGEVFCQKHL